MLLKRTKALEILGLAAAYSVTGGLGMLLASPRGFATAIWPAAGIALAIMLWRGYGVWPGILLGSFLVNLGVSLAANPTDSIAGPLLLATCIAPGAALQAVAATYLVRRFVGPGDPLAEAGSVLRFLLLAGPVASLIGASWGTACLLLAGIVSGSVASYSWCTWWVGDSIGVAMVAPMVMVWTAQPADIWRRRRFSLTLPLALGLAMAVSLFIRANDWDRSHAELEFENQTATLHRALARSFSNDIQAVRAIADLLAAHPEVDRESFRSFVRGPLAQHSALHALSWNPVVPGSERAALEAAMRREGAVGFEIVEQATDGEMLRASPRDRYVVVRYIEPLERNRSALGFDIASDPERLAAIERAAASGSASATPPITLVQGTESQAGLLILVPAYAAAETPTGETREPIGFATGVLLVGDSIRAALAGLDRDGTDIRIFEGDRPLLHLRGDLDRTHLLTAGPDAGPDKSWLHRRLPMQVADRTWHVDYRPGAAVLAGHDHWQVWFVLVSALMFSSLLGAFLLVITGRTARIELLVEEREAAERELAQREQWLSTLLESMRDAVLATDEAGCVVLMNPVCEELTGWKQAEAQGRPLVEVFRLVDERSEKPYPDPRELALAERTAYALLDARDGTRRLIVESAAEIRDRNGSVRGAVLVFRDVTLERRLETEVARIHKLETVGTLAGGIAHDFNNMLSVIGANLELVRNRHSDDAQAELWLRDAESAWDRARGLTRQLLTFARGGAPVLEPVELSRVLVEVGQLVLRGTNTSLHTEIQSDLWPAQADEGQLAQVVSNLIINAQEAMTKGGYLTLRLRNDLRTEPDGLPLPPGRYVCIELEDRGPGVPVDLLEKIFDPFFTTKPEGSGLGLAIAASIVRGHGGHISVASRVGRGTTFTIHLRAASELPARDESRAPEQAPHPGHGRILVMDDDAPVRRALSAALAALGYRSDAVANGSEALAAYQAAAAAGDPYQAVLLDLTVPGGMGGAETVGKLKALDPDARAIVSSGYSNDPIMATYTEYGFIGVLGKPFSVDQLAQVLHDATAT